MMLLGYFVLSVVHMVTHKAMIFGIADAALQENVLCQKRSI
jgi:hypothetical protein